MPSGREERGGLEVASEGRKKAMLGETYHSAEAEVGIEEVSADQVFAGVGGRGRSDVGSGMHGSEEGSSNGKSGSGKRSMVSVMRVAPVLGIRTLRQR
jgi:hypothetical protein